jgi:hypothetical protein
MDVATLFPRGSRQCRGALEFVVDDFLQKISGQRCCVVAFVVVVGCGLFAKSQKSRKNEVFVQIWCSSETGTEYEKPKLRRHNLCPGHLVNTEGLSLGNEF